MSRGRVFNIERCATADGPGIRTTVFLKGCGLRCRWCCNPESQSFRKEIMLKHVKCVQCGRCVRVCPAGAIAYREPYGMISDPEQCNHCGKCVEACYMDARLLQGQDYNPADLMKILERDESYYRKSGGGITFSGGEPLNYPDFIRDCAKLIHERGWTVLIETCGYTDTRNYEEVADDVDIIYCDFKHWDENRHRELTGASNRRIIQNIRWLDRHFKGKLVLRYPYIPGCNAEEEDVRKFLEFASGLPSVHEVGFLPFHRLGTDKYQGLGKEYEMGSMESLRIRDLDFLKEYEDRYQLRIRIG